MPLSRKLTAEFIGTFWLVFGGCGSAVLAATFPGTGIGFLGVALAFGLTVLTMAFAIYLAGDGARAFEACQAEAADDHIFGVPLFVFRGEPFWGHDRMPLLEERLTEAGLRR